MKYQCLFSGKNKNRKKKNINMSSASFLTSPYVVDTHQKHLSETFLMNTHNIRFCGENRKKQNKKKKTTIYQTLLS